MIADVITCSRMLFSLILLAFRLPSAPFAALYLLCGITDVLDGFAARKLHAESERGAKLDSAADLLFAVAYVVRVLPWLSVPVWIRVWTAVIAAAKAAGVLIAGRKTHGFRIEHSLGNKLTGLLLFLLPLSVRFVDVRFGAALICIAATMTAIHELVKAGGETRHESSGEHTGEEGAFAAEQIKKIAADKGVDLTLRRNKE